LPYYSNERAGLPYAQVSKAELDPIGENTLQIRKYNPNSKNYEFYKINES
jgi:hypothetical protein